MSGRHKTFWISAVAFAFAAGICGGLYGPVLWKMATAPIPVTPVQVYDVDDVHEGGIDHFKDVPVVLIRPGAVPDKRTGNVIMLKLIVGPDGAVTSATPVMGPAAYYDDAVALALTWKLKPYMRNGQPVTVRVPAAFVRIQSGERRRDYPVPFPPVRDLSSVKITLDRGPCFGECPIYHLEVRGDGTVDYEGNGFVVVAGRHHAKVPVAVVQHLIGEFRKVQFFSLLPQYAATVTDAPRQKITISFDGYAAAVTDYVGEEAGMPYAVRELENEIDRALDIERWTRGNRETAPSLIAEGWDFKAQSCTNTSLVAGAARYASVDVVRALLVRGAPVHKRCDGKGYGDLDIPALQSAVDQDDQPMIELLLQSGAASYDRDMQLALVDAASRGHEELMMQLTLSYSGPRPFSLKNGQTLLMAAAESCVPQVVEHALWKADVNTVDKRGNAALFYAVGSTGAYGNSAADCAATVKMLLAHGAKTDVHGEYGRTPLLAVLSEAKIAKILIAAGADVNARGDYGTTALMSSYDAGLTRVLLDAGADPWAVDSNGKTALQLAKEGGWQQKESVRLLEAWMKTHPKPKK